MKYLIFLFPLFLFSPITYSTHLERNAALKDIKENFSLVPKFYEYYPASSVGGAWEEMKTLQLNRSTALSGLNKQLIGLAVASQIPCRYCAYFHTEAAKLNGGSDEMIREAIAISSVGRFWETYFEGMAIDYKDFKDATDDIVDIQRKRLKPGYKAPDLAPIHVTDAATALEDIERDLGIVPFFVKPIPKNSLAGIWMMTKKTFFNPGGFIPGKIRNLIMLAAQSDCKHCVYWDTQMAKLYGATDEEIAEAVQMAATTRHWSTWLNGNLFDEKTFRKEMDKVFAYMKKQTKK